MSRDPLHRLLLVNLLSGGSIGLMFLAGLFWTDAYGLRTFYWAEGEGLLVLVTLGLACVATAASIVAGSALMAHRKSHDDDDDHGGGPGRRELIPIRIKSRR